MCSARLSEQEAYGLLPLHWTSLTPRLHPRSSRHVTYSRKAFIPLTRLCRDSCGYCTFASHDGSLPSGRSYLSPTDVSEIAFTAAQAGCTEALFTLGDRPEQRWEVAREELGERGMASTVEYLAAVCKDVLRETTLLPHTNAGVLSSRELAALREVSASQGLMLESTARSLLEPGGAHAGCRTKRPSVRLATIERAGRQVGHSSRTKTLLWEALLSH